MTEDERKELRLFRRLVEAVVAKGGNLNLVGDHVEFGFRQGVCHAYWSTVGQCLHGDLRYRSIFELCQQKRPKLNRWQWLGDMDGISEQEREIRLCAMGF